MRLVLFDMDHTLVPCDSGTLWAEFLSEQNLLSPDKAQQRAAFLQDYQNGTLDVEAAYRFELGNAGLCSFQWMGFHAES